MSLKSALLAGLTLGLASASSLCASQAVAADAAGPVVADKIAGPDGGWDYVTVDSAANRVYVARTAGVTMFDLATKVAVNILPELTRTHIALPINGGKELFVTVGATGEAVIADVASGAVRARVKTGTKPDAAVYDSASGLVWVMDNKGAGITLVNPKTGASEGNIATPGALEFAVSDGAGKVFVNVEDLNELITVDVKSRKVVAHTKLADCDAPTGLALDTAHGLLVSTCANKMAVITSAKTGKVVGKVTIGNGPDAAVYDAAKKLVYIPTGRDGKLFAVNAATAKVVSVTDTQTSARTAQIDPATGRLFTAAASFSPPKADGSRPASVSGTFNLLVLTTR